MDEIIPSSTINREEFQGGHLTRLSSVRSPHRRDLDRGNPGVATHVAQGTN